MRWVIRGLIAGVVAVLMVAIHGYREARRDPVVRRATIEMPNWSTGAPPVSVALLSDIHIGSAAMDSDRLDRIVAQVNDLRPDLVLIPAISSRATTSALRPISHRH